MANICGFDMKIKGTTNNVIHLLNVLINTKLHDTKPHFYRVDEVVITNDKAISSGEVTVSGDCAWDVRSCLTKLDGTSYYNQDIKKGTHSHGTTLEIETKRLNLTVEIYSEESETQEHLIIANGEVKLDEIRHCDTIHTDDYDSVEELNHQNKLNISKKDFEENEILHTGGFDEWVYSI